MTDRPMQPTRLPMRGDDNGAWLAWWNACDACEHSDATYGCVRLGVVEYSNGVKCGFNTLPGGCNSWRRKDGGNNG